MNNLSEALKSIERAIEVFSIVSSSDDYDLVQKAVEALRYIKDQLETKPGGEMTPNKENAAALVIKIFID